MLFDVFIVLLLVLCGVVVAGAFLVGFGMLQRAKAKNDRELVTTRAETDEVRHRARIRQVQQNKEMDALAGKALPMRTGSDDDEEVGIVDKVVPGPDAGAHWADPPAEDGSFHTVAT